VCSSDLGRLGVDNWYPYLNLGFKISPAAGSDYPYYGPSLPGAERYYVKLDGPFDPDAWYASFKAGHVFVTNGPMLDFTINGHGMGDEIHVARGARLDLSASMQLNPDIDTAGQLDVIVHGDVVASQRGGQGDRITLQKQLTADHSMWIAVRANGVRQVPPQGQVQELGAIAHSAPIYVVVDDEPFWKTAALADLVRTERQILQDLLTAPVDPMGDLEAWETVNVLAPQWERQKFLLRPRVDQANAKYDEILRRASSRRSSAAQVRLESLGLVIVAAVALVVVRGRGTRRRR